MIKKLFNIIIEKYKSLHKSFMLSLSESFIDVQSIGNKNAAKDLSDWAKNKSNKYTKEVI